MEKSLKYELINYFETLGIDVYTNTKARGHQGFFLKNRIDISKNIKEEKIIPTLLHEFAHYIHSKIEPETLRTGGNLNVIFDFKVTDFAAISVLQKELSLITLMVDKHAANQNLIMHKDRIKHQIKLLEIEIKKDYPAFLRSKKFKEFDKYIKKSKAKYLLKYDVVKYVSPSFLGLLKKYEIFTLDNLEKDFPEIPKSFCAYLRLKSAQRKQSRISARINKYNKYYSKPTELFARFIEGLYEDVQTVEKIAPMATKRFFELLEQGYYMELRDVFNIIYRNKKVVETIGA